MEVKYSRTQAVQQISRGCQECFLILVLDGPTMGDANLDLLLTDSSTDYKDHKILVRKILRRITLKS